MLIFGNGLRIGFWNVKSQRSEGVVKFKSHLNEDAYMVSIFEFPGKECIVHENQITHVLIKNIFGNNCWVKIDDIYKMFPNGSTIRPDEKYNIDAEFSMAELPKVSLSPIRYTQLSNQSLNYVKLDEQAVGELLFEDTFKQFLKEVKTMNILSCEVEHYSIWSDNMR